MALETPDAAGMASLEKDLGTTNVQAQAVLDKINEIKALNEKAVGIQRELNEEAVKGYAKQRDDLAKLADQQKENIHQVKDHERKIKDATKVNEDLKKSAEGLVKIYSGFGATMKGAVEAVTSKFKDLGNILGSAMPIAAAKMRLELLQSLDDTSGGMLTAQKDTLAFQKGILQAGQSFGETFEGAGENISSFLQRWTDTVNTVKATPEEIRGVTEAFKNVMPIDEQTRNLSSLSRAHGNLKSTLTATNAALLISAAKGMDAGEAAQWMAKATTELGDTTEQAVTNFGKIAWAADKSGLGFNKVGASIMSAADSLKMWGGTVSGVTPLYKAFADSLAGTGRQGLTPQLLQSFVQGLQGMQFGARALLGLQAPGGAAKGALGAGLEMEAALEEGPAGMKKVSENLVGMLKQFGGGKVLTRQEAISDPAMQRNFMVQRQLLMQQMGLDQASANRTLEMLKNIDKSGLDVGGDTQDTLNSMLQSGEKTQEATQAALTKAMNEQALAVNNGTKEIVKAVGNLGKSFGVGGIIKTLEESLTRLVSGAPSMEKSMAEIRKLLGGLKEAVGFGKKEKDTTGASRKAAGEGETDKARQKRVSEKTMALAQNVKLGIGKSNNVLAKGGTENMLDNAPKQLAEVPKPVAATKLADVPKPKNEYLANLFANLESKKEEIRVDNEARRRALTSGGKLNELQARGQILIEKNKEKQTQEESTRNQMPQIGPPRLAINEGITATNATRNESLSLRQAGTAAESKTQEVILIPTIKQRGNILEVKLQIDQESINKGIHNAAANGQH